MVDVDDFDDDPLAAFPLVSSAASSNTVALARACKRARKAEIVLIWGWGWKCYHSLIVFASARKKTSIEYLHQPEFNI